MLRSEGSGKGERIGRSDRMPFRDAGIKIFDYKILPSGRIYFFWKCLASLLYMSKYSEISATNVTNLRLAAYI